MIHKRVSICQIIDDTQEGIDLSKEIGRSKDMIRSKEIVIIDDTRSIDRSIDHKGIGSWAPNLQR
jgi:hypothetical protein